MQVQNFSLARQELLHLAEEDLMTSNEARSLADKLIGLIGKFPALKTDAESAAYLCKLTEKLFSFKEHLNIDRQSQIAELFWTAHHLSSSKVPKLMENHEPADKLVDRFKDIEAILPDDQLYPIPIDLLKGEKMPCDTYFRPLKVLLNDETEVTISQGLLAHYSETVQAMIRNREMAAPETLTLMQLNRHQFDTMVAFLETGQKALINKENAPSLMFAAAFLQIPELMEECALYLYLFLDDENALSLLNTVPKNSKRNRLIDEAETYLSGQITKGLLVKKPTPEFLRKLALYKQALINPMRLSLAGSDVTDDALKELEDFPLQELDLSSCPKLTKRALQHLSKNKTLRTLHLGGNAWVDDDALKEIPKSVESLTLSACRNFSKQGLKFLGGTSVKELALFGCSHLKDEDFQELPKQFVALDLSYCPGVSSRTAERLGEMGSLKKLILSEVPMSGEHLHLLPKTIEFLNVAGCGLDDTALAALTRMNRLTELHLESCPITDGGLPLLPPSIRLLSLNGCGGLTDKGAEGLAGRTHLKKVFLRRCPKITKKGLEKFDKSVEVGWDESQPSRMARHFQ